MSGIRVTGYGLRGTGDGLPATGHGARVSGLMLLAVVLLLLALAGCGGGGGGGGGKTVHVTGRVLNVVTGGATNPASSVQIGSASTTTSTADGSFAVDAPVGATSVVVDTTTTWGSFAFAIPALTGDTVDVGDLYVGPEKVAVAGTVRNSTNGDAISGATVTFGGRTATTDASGAFTLANVAYSSTSPAGFYGIVGHASATGFFSSEFTAADLTPTSGTITVDDVLLTPSNDNNPPSGPYNLWGTVSPSASAPGATATLYENGTAIRITTVGQDGRYYFWVGAGTYKVVVTKGSLSATVPSVTITDGNDVEERDVTLS